MVSEGTLAQVEYILQVPAVAFGIGELSHVLQYLK